jgi:hypothetical protein
MADLEILFPTALHDVQSNPLCATVLAVGRVRRAISVGGADRNVKTVSAHIQHYVNGTLDPTIIKKTRTRILRPVGNAHFLWAAVLKHVSGAHPTRVRLTAEAFEKGNSTPLATRSVDLWLKPNFVVAPTIDWPDTDGYTVQGDEREYFLTYGSSDLPLTAVKLNGVDAHNQEWFIDDDFWWAMYSPAPTGNNQTLLVSNADDDTPRTVNVV